MTQLGRRSTMPTPHWEHFHHRADIGVRGFGDTLATAFEQTAIALTAVLTDPALVAARDEVEIRCSAPDLELLLVDWLNALIYEMASRRMLFGRYSAHIAESQHGEIALSARAWGELVEPGRHQPAVEVKGATYTALVVGKTASGSWRAQCVVDV